MAHPGVAPLDPDTLVGQLRVLVGDTTYTPLTPPEEGMGDYAVFSDSDLEAAITAASGSLMRAAGNLTLTLATQYSAQGKSIKTDDLAIDLRSRGPNLLAVAKAFFDQADADEQSTSSDFFQIAPFGGRRKRSRIRPEGTPWPLT